ncbi:50S ribosomal protein L29 [Mycoplasmopsis lipofaciens]|uniref:50S ribosomal protein L29 n=1 Tax=Mycoplasmopsis lipofaciens TaxID=114884 RepID=UPI00047F198B|nr:50S ribosomal protein L29 [Mycoplasmopsis lipofaciens]
MLYKDIKGKSVEELQKLIADLKAELFTLRFQNVTGQLDQSHKIKVVRKDIAKALTALNELKSQEAKGAK